MMIGGIMMKMESLSFCQLLLKKLKRVIDIILNIIVKKPPEQSGGFLIPRRRRTKWNLQPD